VRRSADVEVSSDVSADEARQARLAVIGFLAAVVVCVLGADLALYADRRDDGGSVPIAAFDENPAIEGASQGPAAIGPTRGAPLDQYVTERKRALATLRAGDDGVVAVVSFERYATEDEARRAVSDAVEVLGLLVAAPGGTPEVVQGALSEWGEAARVAAAEERAEIEKLISSGTVDDPDYADFYAAEVVRLRRLEQALDPDGAVVFGLVVRGPVAALRAIAGAPGVRLVDAAAGDVDDQADVRGLRPEETLKSGEPATRP
jgi:hypothetical protein